MYLPQDDIFEGLNESSPDIEIIERIISYLSLKISAEYVFENRPSFIDDERIFRIVEFLKINNLAIQNGEAYSFNMPLQITYKGMQVNGVGGWQKYLDLKKQPPNPLMDRTFTMGILKEFDERCAYCKLKISPIRMLELDRFYPKNLFPEKAALRENLFPVCIICNRNKRDHFPVNANGEPLLLNPREDNFDDHIRVETDGYVTPLSEKGKTTIDLLKLNRVDLIEERKVNYIQHEISESNKSINAEFYERFENNLEVISDLLSISSKTKEKLNQYLNNMLFANVITCTETYLSDALKYIILENEVYFRKFVETFHEFKKQKFDLSDLYIEYENIKDKAAKAASEVLYHDLPKVKGMYKDALGIIFPSIEFLMKAILKRHDFVHRNGKTIKGEYHQIGTQDIEQLIKEAKEFIKTINDQLIKLI